MTEWPRNDVAQESQAAHVCIGEWVYVGERGGAQMCVHVAGTRWAPRLL